MSDHEETSDRALEVFGDQMTTALGIPLPPEVKRSLWKALGALITGLADVPAAWLESKAAGIRGESSARSVVLQAAGQASAQHFAGDAKLVERSTLFLANRLLREQRNREAITAAAVKDIKERPPTVDSTKGIDDDWLSLFSKVAEGRSSSEMQAYMSRVLAGEIRRPGSFSPMTLDVAAKLTTDLAEMFLTFCNASTGHTVRGCKMPPAVLAGVFGNYPQGGNGAVDVGLPYWTLLQLQDAGLVSASVNSVYNIAMVDFMAPFDLAGSQFRAHPRNPSAIHPEATAQRSISAIFFTRAGLELRTIVDKTPHPVAVAKLRIFLAEFELELAAEEPTSSAAAEAGSGMS